MKKLFKEAIALICIVTVCISFTLVNAVPANGANLPPSKITIAIDPGHQQKADLSKERIDPDNKKIGSKYKVTGGCTSVYNKMPEYKYTLIIAKKLKKQLEAKGYNVVLTRNKDKVNISNQQRAKIINNSGAKVCIRLHCDSYGKTAHGVSTIYKPTPNSVYSKGDAARSKVLAKYLLDSQCKETGFAKRKVSARNDLTTQNFSKIPVALIEMGFFSNYKEAKKMNSETYRNKISTGITKGLEKYLNRYYNTNENKL
ncbi:MAG: N-acetylmuramoyl-L-alanine amidase [Anaerovoracaceae bacterium]